MSNPTKLCKMAQKANETPRWDVSTKTYLLKRKFKTKSVIRKCLRQLKNGAKQGQTRVLVYNFKFGYEEGRLWIEQIFDERYMSDVISYLKKRKFTTSECCVMNKIPKKWKKLNYFDPVEALSCITDQSLRCMLVDFGDTFYKKSEASSESETSE